LCYITSNMKKSQIPLALIQSTFLRLLSSVGHRTRITSLRPIEEKENKTSVQLTIPWNNSLNKCVKKSPLNKTCKFVYYNHSLLKTKLPPLKEPIPFTFHCGVYVIYCCHCNFVYIGQTVRSLRLRFIEHLRYISSKNNDSAIYQHYNNYHKEVPICNISPKLAILIKTNVRNELNLYESAYIKLAYDSKIQINKEPGPIDSPIISWLTNHLKIPSINQTNHMHGKIEKKGNRFYHYLIN
jgi:hypothetical protein